MISSHIFVSWTALVESMSSLKVFLRLKWIHVNHIPHDALVKIFNSTNSRLSAQEFSLIGCVTLGYDGDSLSFYKVTLSTKFGNVGWVDSVSDWFDNILSYCYHRIPCVALS